MLATESTPKDKIQFTSEGKFCIVACAFVASWGMMQLLTVKAIPLDLQWLGLGISSFVMAEFLFAVTFPLTDVITEVWGARRARYVVFGGIIVNAVAAALITIASWLPSPAYWQAQNDAYTLLFATIPRLWFASISAVVVSQLLDIYVFNVIRNITGEKWLWLRNNGSTLVSQAVDTIIFYGVAFLGLIPIEALLGLLIGNYILKIAFAALDTPLVYLLVSWAKR